MSLLGDVNGDGVIDWGDEFYLSCYVNTDYAFDDFKRENADINSDGVINIQDYNILIDHLNNGTSLPSPAASSQSSGTNGSIQAIGGIKEVLGKATEPMHVKNLIKPIGIVISLAAILFFFWFGSRWVIRKIKSAFKKGKINV